MKKKILKQKILLLALLSLSYLGLPHPAWAFSEIATTAPYVLLMDAQTGTTLFERNADTLMSPASMTKIATISLLFDAIKSGQIRLEDEFVVSKNAVKEGGERSGSSSMFLEPESAVHVEDLIRGIIIQSGNDAAITIAEALAPSEQAFAEKMTAYVRKLGLSKTLFKNATGWPTEGHETTPRELAQLARHHIAAFPEFYHYYAERSFTWNNITQANRNFLLRDKLGVDGLKTGHTEESGFGIVVSAKRGEQRLILVLNGLKSEQERRGEAYKILLWGFRSFRTYSLVRAGQEVEKAYLWHGMKSRIPLTVKDDLNVAITREKRRLLRVSIDYQSPIVAPVKKNQQVGVIRVKELGGDVVAEKPLVVAFDVDELNFFGRAVSTLEYMLFGG